jgi:hypothetical protein
MYSFSSEPSAIAMYCLRASSGFSPSIIICFWSCLNASSSKLSSWSSEPGVAYFFLRREVY